MKLTLGDLVAAQQPLERLVQCEVEARVAFQLARTVRQINVELQSYGVAQKALLDRMGTLSEDKSQYHVASEHQEEFATEMRELLDSKVEVDVTQIAEADLPDMTAADAMALWWLVE